jgi:hypothetical protein
MKKPMKFKSGGKIKRYDGEEGSVVEGQNANIGDDTRARAMKYVKDREENPGMYEAEPEVKSVTKTRVTRSVAKPAPAPVAKRSEAREPSGEPTPGRKSDWRTDSELGRNVSNTMNAMGPTKLAGLGNAAMEGAMTARAASKLAAREAKTLNPSAWLAGPKGMKENFKKGGAVKAFAKGGSVGSASSRGDGIAIRGKTKGTMAKMCGGGMAKAKK